MMKKFIAAFLEIRKQKTRAAFFLFESIILVSIFFSVIIVVFNVINVSNSSIRRNLQYFNSICQTSDLYNENLKIREQVGNTIYLDGVKFIKISVKTDVGIKYVFIKK